jgi:glycine cleavage system H protein
MASCCEVESTKSVSEIFSPVSGTVAEVNTDLSDAPQMINEDPYGKGWIFAVEIADAAEVDSLMDAGAYQAFLAEEH